MLLPSAQPVQRAAIGATIVPPQGLDRCPIGPAVELVDEVAILDGALFASSSSFAETPLTTSISKRLFSVIGLKQAIAPSFGEITRLGSMGTIQPVSGQRVSRQ